MALLSTMGLPSAPLTGLIPLLAAVQQLAQHIPRDPTGSTCAGNSSSWANNLAGVRASFDTGLGSHPLLGTPYQGWEFAHLISEPIARFLSKNEQMSDSLKQMSYSLIC